jgi:hypothetical protein
MQLTEQRIREIVREEIKAALEERDAASKTALLDFVKSSDFKSKIQSAITSALDLNIR